ncbi:hypothetical protein TKK_0001708 [Trichogramma kaykai]
MRRETSTSFRNNTTRSAIYTGHALRRSSATIAADLGADLITLKRLGKWKSSTVAEGYIDDSKLCKKNNSKLIASALDIKKPCTAVASADCMNKHDRSQPSTSSRKLPGEILPEDDTVQQPKKNAKPLRKPLLPQNNNIVISQHKLSDNELKDCQLTLDDYHDFVMQKFEVSEHANGIKQFNPNSSDKSNAQYNNRNEKENPVYIFKNCNVTINNKLNLMPLKKPHKGIITVPGRLDSKTIFQRIESLYPGLGTEQWRVFSEVPAKEGQDPIITLVLGLPESSVRKLREQDFAIAWGLGRVRVKVDDKDTDPWETADETE